MPRFAASLMMQFADLPLIERIGAAARCGFKGVEIQSPYSVPVDALSEELARHDIALTLVNVPRSDADPADRGVAALPGREAEFRDRFGQALDYASALDCPLIHVTAGVADGIAPDAAFDTYLANLRTACDQAAAHGISIIVEAINPYDMPGYFMNDLGLAQRAIAAADRSNLGLLLDLYHCQRMHGALADHIRDLASITRHIQVAGAPGRHEPDIGEINYPYLFSVIDRTGYEGWIGCEYHPMGDTAAGLGWLRRVRQPG